ncbi:MAG: acyl-CoA dehydrogenase family protein [Gammaproteobacteria bacterium]|nr:acyl-CoA dehydrogenase family protein [Gammaproteobacteria bacterium]MDE0284858.1 acyl-CoA dehydrogenase family protein [Gammaproteobacteria bacterium]MDE0512628.1 acyl-CoA dehydrogenase family protein [Gammaproteobacteria bacterium]
MGYFHFDVPDLADNISALRREVREFISGELPAAEDSGDGFCPEFSRKCGQAGFIGMTWPRRYGGGERSYLERHVVAEELLAARAPIRAHWVADRQSGAILLKYATAELCKKLLPDIARGECYFCIGMSEANSGSDLFSIHSRAEKTGDGWLINGSKLWTSHAHRTQYMIALLRTSAPAEDDRRFGLTQFLIPMSAAGVTIRPVYNLAGEHDFNEVLFENVLVPHSHMLGKIDEGWKQVTDELIYERSSPDRFLETIPVLYELIRLVEPRPDARAAEGIGRLAAQLSTLRQMSISTAAGLDQARMPGMEAAIVKDLGTCWEQDLPSKARELVTFRPGEPYRVFDETCRRAMLLAPKLTIQGGTTEVLRGIIARGLGLR